MSPLNKKILYTIAILAIARLGVFIPMPGIDNSALYSEINQNAFANFLNVFSGGGLSTIGIFTLGIVPYINASIVTQLAVKIIPELESLQNEEGESGRSKITQITRYLTLVWAILQSIAIALWIKAYVFKWGIGFIIDCITTLATGSIIIMWLSEVITEYGIGNGASLLIFQNIVSGIPKNLHDQHYSIDIENLRSLVITGILFTLMLSVTILVQEGSKKVIIVSAKQLSQGSKVRSRNYIPLKMNQGGVMPIVFASAAMAIPTYISRVTGVGQAIAGLLPNKAAYIVLYGGLIIAFSYFYTSLVLNPDDIAKNLKKMGASIPGVRPGNKTSKYLKQILNRLTFLGSIFLFLIALIPSLITGITNIKAFQGFGATSLLILVGVAIDTAKQIQAYVISEKYNVMIQ